MSDVQTTSLVPIDERETAISAVAAQVVANVQARYALAKRMPRDLDEMRVKLLQACKRPRFAEAAIYHKPIGTGVEGPSIRFVEEALRCFGNVMPESVTVFDDTEKRIVRVSVTDLENNITYSKDITIAKTVERSNPKDRKVIAERLNSRGKTVYIVRATDEEILDKESSMLSKAIRDNGRRLLPADIVDEAIDQCYETRRDKDSEDPGAAIKRLVLSFAAIGVKPADLVEQLRHPIDQTTPDELAGMRSVYTAIKDGDTTWSEIVSREEEPQPEKQAKTNATKEALKNKRGKGGKQAKTAPPKKESVEPPPEEEPPHPADFRPPATPTDPDKMPEWDTPEPGSNG